MVTSKSSRVMTWKIKSGNILLYIEGKKEMFYLMMHSTYLFMVVWHWACGKGPLIYWEKKPAVANSWDIFLN